MWQYVELYLLVYYGESVNRSQRKTCDIRTWKNTFISQHILHQHWYTCPIALPMRRNPQHRSSLTVVSATSTPPFQPLRHQRNLCHPVVNRFTRQTLPTVNMKRFFINILCVESVCPQKKKSITERCSSVVTLLKHGRHFDYWNQSLNMSIRVCYLDCHEAGLCCYVVIHIENLLHPLQLLYFHSGSIYWLSLVQHCAILRCWNQHEASSKPKLLRPKHYSLSLGQ
jgi:hypothetical protein